MPLLNDQTREEVKKVLDTLDKPITLDLYTLQIECGLCKDTHQLLSEIAELTTKITINLHELESENQHADTLKIEKLPAIIIKGEKDYGIRFFGIPAGYEFTSLMAAMLLVSRGELMLKPETKAFLDTLQKPVHIEVITTPTCPFCPGMVVIAHQMAYYSDKVLADMIEISEFPTVANKYHVEGVPRTVINEKIFLDGAAPEDMLVDKIKEALNV
ncbi:MAG TPA: thioredoxin family protein [Candidatus Cloacimonadota bacterium]|nr:thioredoxin family protein [Candidatus Cloacimonadota bacterium]